MTETKTYIKQLKRENQEIRELVNNLEKNKEKIALGISEYDDYYSYMKGFNYVLNEIKEVLKTKH